ncbi:MAG: DUF4153 domain-containing protein [Allosphingosinicella sp.]|uniref:DUF4153 domain-containing protein n=1 Tax=Allosphingosinicella sp. TaxID=2823234 RepID=UPI00394A3139
MGDSLDDSDASGLHGAWPLRALLLLALGAAVGVSAYLLMRGDEPWRITDDRLRLAVGSLIIVGGAVFAFVLERQRWLWAVGFALAAGLAVGGVTFWAAPEDRWTAGGPWQLFSALIAVAVAAPLFQTARDFGRWSPDYRAIHAHAWTNAVLWFAAWLFVLVTFLLMMLLAELFSLLQLRFLRELLGKSWFLWMLTGGVFGGAVGMLRDRDRVIGLLQRVVTAILSVLAPVLAIGLVLFVAALPFTGLQPLWRQTASTTPILLSCILGAILLINAVIGNAPEEEGRSPVLRYSALALGAVMAPLAVVTVLSLARRIGQHGFTPDRLWAVVFVAILSAYAAAYLYALLKGRQRWGGEVRRVNLGLAVGLCLLTLLLATPLFDVGAISTRNQLARLEKGAVSPEKFDWRAMRFEFGPAGRRAVERLARSGPSAEIRAAAVDAMRMKDRYASSDDMDQPAREIVVRPNPVTLPDALRKAVLNPDLVPFPPCSRAGQCTLFWQPGAATAIALDDGCAALAPAEQTDPERRCTVQVTVFEMRGNDWQRIDRAVGAEVLTRTTTRDATREMLQREREAIERGEVELREVTRGQVFIGDRPVSRAFE